ncbi:MAG TPA: alkaline phosphatase family protein, partial [Pseudonocardiaceae bacterium]|nr:alkaline phosphatase family protein [Pseudonocardiaceae bacterium]
LMRAAWFGPLVVVVRSMVRRYGVPGPALSWRLLSGPIFGNAVATLVFSDRNAELVIEKSGTGGQLEPVSQITLTDPNGQR